MINRELDKTKKEIFHMKKEREIILHGYSPSRTKTS